MAAEEVDLQFFNETSLELPVDLSVFKKITSVIAEEENSFFEFIELVYVDIDKIIQINKEHLKRDYITDIITFRYDSDETNTAIEGTLFCCAPRIVEQAKEFNESAEKEFLRVYIHGLLHLVGYDDQSESEKKKMTDLEDYYLAMA
jgi:rRNA maturation RNase YbeY